MRKIAHEINITLGGYSIAGPTPFRVAFFAKAVRSRIWGFWASLDLRGDLGELSVIFSLFVSGRALFHFLR